MTDITIRNSIPSIWPVDCVGQQRFVSSLINSLDQAITLFNSNRLYTVFLKQVKEPTKAEWESAWMIQTGRSLPIPPNAELLWYNVISGKLDGVYKTTPNDGTPVRLDTGAPGTVAARAHNYAFATTSATIAISERTDMPTVSITTTRTCTLYLKGFTSVDISSGSGTWGLDLSVNGTRMGVTNEGLLVDQGLVEFSRSSAATIEYVLQNQPAGTYEVKLLMGVVDSPGTPPTLDIDGASYLSVEAIVE